MVNTKTFQSAVAQVAPACQDKASLPVLTNIRVSVRDGRMTLTALNLMQEISASADVANGETWATLVNGKRLRDIASAMASSYPDADLVFEIQGDRLAVKCRRHRYTLSTMPVEDFPELESDNQTEALTMDRLTLLGALNAVIVAVARDDVRFYLNGALITPEPDGVRLVGTDGHRLTTTVIQVEAGELAHEIILPRESLEMMRGLLKGADEPVTLHVGSRFFRLTVGDAMIASKTIDGRFPDWRRVVSGNPSHHVEVRRDELLSALRGVAVLGERGVGVRLGFEADVLTLEASNAQHDDGIASVDTKWVSPAPDAPMMIGFNAGYLSDVLAAFTGDVVTLSFTDANASMQLACELNGPLSVLMPMRL